MIKFLCIRSKGLDLNFLAHKCLWKYLSIFSKFHVLLCIQNSERYLLCMFLLFKIKIKLHRYAFSGFRCNYKPVRLEIINENLKFSSSEGRLNPYAL